MISATALNASTVPLNKSPQMPLGLDNSRLRVDSQKFLVPSLPVSSRQINPRGDHHHNSHSQQHHQQQHHHNPHLHYSQQHHNGVGGDKRRERSILNGTAHPFPPPESSRMSAHSHGLNGLRRSTSPLGGKGSSPNYSHNMQGSPRKDAHSPMYGGEVPGLSGSPGSIYSARSSVPIPCSSPSPGSSASPKSTNSHSSNSNGGSATSYSPHLPPGLNPGANGASELSQLAVAAAAAAAASGGRLYPPGFPPPSAAAAHHAAYFAAAAAAAGHSLPYPSLFGSHFPSHQHPAATASSYLDFHSKLLRNSSAVAEQLRSPSQSPPSRSYHPAASPQQQQQAAAAQHILQPIGSPQSTSVTSLHTKLIESVTAAGERFHSHHTGHNHNHIHSGGRDRDREREREREQQQHEFNRFNQPSAGVSKGGPLGISGGIMGLSISPNSNSPHKGHAGSAATSATPEMGSKSSAKLYMEHPGLPGNNNGGMSQHERERKLLAEMDLINGNKAKEAAVMMAKQRMLSRSLEDFSSTRHQQQQQHHHHHPHQNHHHHQQEQPLQKPAKSISFASDVHSGGMHRPNNHPYMNGHAHHHHPPPSHHHHLHSQQQQHTQGHHNHNGNNSSSSSGPTNLSTDCKRANNGNTSHNLVSTSQQHHLFLPPSPKKRSAYWNFAVPQSPLNNGSGGKVGDLLPPPPPPSDNLSESSNPLAHISSTKYLSQSPQNQKPSNGGPGGVGTGTPIMAPGVYHHYQSSSSSSAQPLLVVPSSPLSSSSPSSHGGSGSSGPSTPKSPSVHFKFFGSSANNKENNGSATSGSGRNGRILNARNDSSSSTSSVELGVINGNGRSRPSNGHCGPWPVEQMPLISAFRKGSMIKLASGDIRPVEDLKEDDFEKAVQLMADSVRIVYCHVISIQASQTDSSLCKVTLAMGAAHNQQVVVESTPEQPFFIRGRGWASSSPKLTENILQLPCSTLAVGDVCITLTRQVRLRGQSNSSASLGGHPLPSPSGRGSKSKSGTTRPYGTYAKRRNASTSSILKSSHQIQQRGNNATKMNGRNKLVIGQRSAATNQDVSNTTGLTSSSNGNNNANPILRQTTTTATTLESSSLAEKEERHQDRLTKEEKDETNSSSDHISPTLRPNNPNNLPLQDPQQSTAAITDVSLDSKEASTSSSLSPTTATSSSSSTTIPASSTNQPIISRSSPTTRKSISPCPPGSQKSNEEADDHQNDVSGLQPPSPKKRRWSAPDHIEAESQQNGSTGDGTKTGGSSPASIKSSLGGTTTTSSNSAANPENKEDERKSNSSSKVEGNKDCMGPRMGSPTDNKNSSCSSSSTSETRSSNVVPLEKA